MSLRFRKEIERLYDGLVTVTTLCLRGVRRGISNYDGVTLVSICVEACAPAPTAIQSVCSELLPYRSGSEPLCEAKASSGVDEPAAIHPGRLTEKLLGIGLDRPRKTINFARDDLESIFHRPSRRIEAAAA